MITVAAWMLGFAIALPGATVVLQNGDHISGDIEGFKDKKLGLKTGYAGTVRISWDQIAELHAGASKVMLEVVSGRRYTGTIQKRGDQVQLQSEDVRREISTQDVVSIVPVKDSEKPGFWQLLTGSFDVGYSFSRGNSRQTQSSLAAKGQYRTQTYKAQASLNSIFSETDDSEPTSRHALEARLDRYLSPRTFAFALTGFERNDRQNLDLRSKFGGGFGWTLVDGRRTQFNILGGFTYTDERFRVEEGSGEDPTRQSGEGLAGFEWQTRGFRDVQFSTKLSYHPNIVESGRYRIEYDNSIRIPVISSLAFSVSLFDRYDSAPQTDVLRNDYGLISAFGFTF